jgi:hypothetical protein
MATNPIKSDKPQPSDSFNQIGPNVSPKHRAILEAALAMNNEAEFRKLLMAMPNVGEDSDFAPGRD